MRGYRLWPSILVLLHMLVSHAAVALTDGKACYLSWLELYTAHYSEVADRRCVRLDYLRDLSAENLAEATVEALDDLYGAVSVAKNLTQIRRLVDSYEDVGSGDSYLYCVSAEGGELRRGDRAVATVKGAEVANQIMGIWVGRSQNGQMQWNFTSC